MGEGGENRGREGKSPVYVADRQAKSPGRSGNSSTESEREAAFLSQHSQANRATGMPAVDGSVTGVHLAWLALAEVRTIPFLMWAEVHLHGRGGR